MSRSHSNTPSGVLPGRDVRFGGPSRLRIDSTGHGRLRAHRVVLERMISLDYDDRDRFRVRLALEEALVNAAEHGNQGHVARTIQLDYVVSVHGLWIRVEDEGDGFDPQLVPDPTLPENFARPGGRGLLLIRSFMDFVEYNQRGNAVTMGLLRAREPSC